MTSIRPAWLLSDQELQSSREQSRLLAETIDRFKRLHPEQWDELRLCPLQHGLETMVEMLRRKPPAMQA